METASPRKRGRPPKTLVAQADPDLEALPDHPDLITEERVKRVYFHNGVYLGNFVKLSIDADVNDADLKLHPMGVDIYFRASGRRFIAPIGMITGIELAPRHD